MVLSWLPNTLKPNITDSVIYSTTAYEIWEDLRERFSQSNTPRIFQIQRNLSSLTQDQLSVAAYYTKLKALWDEFASYSDLPSCTCGAIKKHVERKERNALMQFLMGLNESFSVVHCQILLMQPLPSMHKAYSLICQEEKQRELGSSSLPIEHAAMTVHQDQKTSNLGRKPLHYTYCDQDHHTRETCWKLNGYPLCHWLHKPKRSNSGRNKGSDGSSFANQVSSSPSLQEIQTAMPNLSVGQS